MQFSDTTNKTGLIQDCERILFNEYGAISDNSVRLLEFTTLLNQALDETATDIMKVDRNWKWDDSSYTDVPVATTDVVDGQGGYGVDVSFLTISKVEIADEDGNFRVLGSINEDESDTSFSERFETDGQPTYFELRGDQLNVWPAPDYDYTAGLKVHYQRTFDRFTSSDTTATPGCPSIFHPLISMRAAYKYAFSNGVTIKDDLAVEIAKYVNNLKGFMRDRNPRGANKFIPKFKSSK